MTSTLRLRSKVADSRRDVRQWLIVTFLRALFDLPLARVNLPSGHFRVDGLVVQVVCEDPNVLGSALGHEDGNLCIVIILFEAPADHVAGKVEVSHQGDSAQTSALQLTVVEVDAIDPEATLSIDELAIESGLELGGIDLIEVGCIAGQLPCELVGGLTSVS